MKKARALIALCLVLVMTLVSCDSLMETIDTIVEKVEAAETASGTKKPDISYDEDGKAPADTENDKIDENISDLDISGEILDESEASSDTLADTEIVEEIPSGDTTDSYEVDLGGALYVILGREDPNTLHLDNFEICYEEVPEDVVGKAVYERNKLLREKYNFYVVQVLADNTSQVAALSYEAGEDLYDLVLYQPQYVQAYAQSGFLLDLMQLPNINLEHNSWSQAINNQLTINGKLYYTTNDFLLLDKLRTHLIYYNRDFSLDRNLGYLEDMVDNGTWTLENAAILAKQASVDIDSNGPTYTDYFGFAMDSYNQCTHLAMSAGFRLVEKNENDLPQLAGATDRMLNIFDDALELSMDRNAAWCYEASGLGEYEADSELMFMNNKVLLLSTTPTFIEYNYKFTPCNVDFGVLPNPKYDVTQRSYYSYPDLYVGSVFGVPYTVCDEKMAGFCLEALTEASTDSSYVAFIDNLCNINEVVDEDRMRMLDLCFENQVYDMGALVFNGDNELYTDCYNIAKRRLNLYKRLFDKYKKACQTELDQLIIDYTR